VDERPAERDVEGALGRDVRGALRDEEPDRPGVGPRSVVIRGAVLGKNGDENDVLELSTGLLDGGSGGYFHPYDFDLSVKIIRGLRGARRLWMHGYRVPGDAMLDVGDDALRLEEPAAPGVDVKAIIDARVENPPLAIRGEILVRGCK
jgi:hypothetical protein